MAEGDRSAGHRATRRLRRPRVEERSRAGRSHRHYARDGPEAPDVAEPAAPKPPGFTPFWQRPTAALEGRDPRAITEPHRRRLDGGRLLATTPRLDWAALLRRTYDVDVLVCPRCRGPARVVAAIAEPAVIRKILAHVREPPARAPPSGAKEPELDDAADGDAWVEPEVDVG